MSNPVERVRTILKQSNNYFSVLEDAAVEFRNVAKLESLPDFGLSGDNTLSDLAGYVKQFLGLRVRIMPVEVMQNQLRRYDLHRREWLKKETIYYRSQPH